MKNYKKRTLEDVKIYRLRVQQLKDMLDYITGKISAPRYGGVERGKASWGYVDGNRIIYTVAEIMKTEEDLKIAQQHYNSVLAKAEKMLDGDVEGFYRLKDALDMLDGYEYVVIDTAPSLNVILYNCLIAADEVIIPVTADKYAMQGIDQLSSTIMAVQRRQNRDLSIAGLLLVKYAGRSNLERNFREEIGKNAQEMGTRLFDTVIRECVKTKEAQDKKKLLSTLSDKEALEKFRKKFPVWKDADEFEIKQ